jgi:hypothetical protein
MQLLGDDRLDLLDLYSYGSIYDRAVLGASETMEGEASSMLVSYSIVLPL